MALLEVFAGSANDMLDSASNSIQTPSTSLPGRQIDLADSGMCSEENVSGCLSGMMARLISLRFRLAGGIWLALVSHG